MSYLAMDNGVLAKDDNLAGCRDHEGRRHRAGHLALHSQALGQLARAIDVGFGAGARAIGGAIGSVAAVRHDGIS